MDIANSAMANDHGQFQFRNAAPNYCKRNVRSMSFCPPSSTYLLQRPQMRPCYGDVNIIDLTSENKTCPPIRKSKSTVSKPTVSTVPAVPEHHHKGRRLSKYLGLHRMSLSGFSSESSKNKNGPEEGGKSILGRFSKNGIEDGTKSLGRKFSKNNSGTDNESTGTETLPKQLSMLESYPIESSEADETDCGTNSEENLEISHSSPDSLNSISIRKDIKEKRDKLGSPEYSRGGTTAPLSENIDAPMISSFYPKNFVHHSTSIRNVQPYNGKTKQIYSTLSYREKFDLTCKVVLLGDSGVGKTCLLMKFKDGAFLSGSYISTVGIDFRNKVVNIDGSKVKLQIWDTAGQERFRSVTHAYYRDAHALLLLYDVTSKTTFDNTRAWLAEVHEYAQDDVVIMLIGNKCDAPFSERQVRKEDGERLAREYNVTFMETSAKTGLNVDLAFNAVARDLKARKSDNIYEKNFNVSDYVQREAKTDSCTCNIG